MQVSDAPLSFVPLYLCSEKIDAQLGPEEAEIMKMQRFFKKRTALPVILICVPALAIHLS